MQGLILFIYKFAPILNLLESIYVLNVGLQFLVLGTLVVTLYQGGLYKKKKKESRGG